jgi:phosphate transport system permease protein
VTFDKIDHELTKRRKRKDLLFRVLCFAVASLAVVLLLTLLGKILFDGLRRLDWAFLTSSPSEVISARGGGILPSLVGSGLVVLLSSLIVVPVGVASAIYLEEMVRRKNWLTETIEVNINNLSGVPSIVYGMLGLGVFVGIMGMGKGLIVGALTMALLILPMVILISREAIRAVPRSFREASLALGASEGQTIWRVVLPNAMPGILTGIILAISRAIGETAPLIVVGAVTMVSFFPTGINDTYSALPLQIFNWSARAQPAFHEAAAGAIIVLMGVLLILNSVAIYLRAKAQSKQKA